MISQRHPRDTVTEYVEGVLAGDIVVGKLQRMAVERYVHDLAAEDSRGFYFDGNIATRAVLFSECLPHSIGEFAGQPFRLEPWQAFIVWNMFGWRRKGSGFRRFKRAYITIAAKNGKTTLTSELVNYLVHADEPFEPGAHVFICGPKLDQAKLCFNEARRMVEASRHLSKRCDIYRANPPRIVYRAQESIIQPIALDGNLDGINAHAIIIDELHAMREKHREGREKIAARGASRRQAIEIMITTAGHDGSHLWIEEDEYATRVLESVVSGNVVDDSYFAFIARIDDDDDPFDPKCWVKANPNFGVSVKPEFLAEEANRAKVQPSKANEFIRYHCNRRVSALNREITAEMWAKGAGPCEVPIGAEGFGGIDLGSTDDFTAIAAVFPEYEENEEGRRAVRWRIKAKCWTAREGRLRIDREPFRSWIADGLLETCEGNRVDYRDIEREVQRWSEKYNIARWAFDPNFARDLSQRLQDECGLEVKPFTQVHSWYNEGCLRFCSELTAGNILHGNDPMLGWQAGNVMFSRNHAGLVKPDKGGAREGKIDAMVAVFMAFSECLFAERNGHEGDLAIF